MDVAAMTQFSDLPSCLVMDILSRLPITTLVACRRVCKDWIRLFQEPYFIKLQLAASPTHVLSRLIWRIKGNFQFGEVMQDKCTDEEEEDLQVKVLNLPTKVNLLNLLPTKCPPTTAIFDYGCINSCNGLICLVDRDFKPPMTYTRSFVLFARSVCVCNPILGEWLSISTPIRNYSSAYGEKETTMALVFSAKNNQYKLLHGFEYGKNDYGFEIYTLGGTREWRSIHDTLGCRPWGGHYLHQDFRTFLHGSLHWTYDSYHICCFDVDNEKFRSLSLLPDPGKPYHDSHLGAINGCLCALYFYGTTEFVEIWVMKEYGVEESWSMMLTFNASGINLARFLFSLNEEEILISDQAGGLASYNLKSNRRRHWRHEMMPYYFHSGVAYKPSFISLQDVAKGEKVILSRTLQREKK